MTEELPRELIDPDAPLGTPLGVHATAHSARVHCWHPDGKGGWVVVTWQRRPGGWYADDQLFEQHPGHDTPARDVAVIFQICGLVSGTDNPRCAPSAEIRAWAAAQPEKEPEADMPDPTA